MRKTAILLGLFFLLVSCEKDDRPIAFKQLTKMEQARKGSVKAFSSWFNHEDSEIRLRAVEAVGTLQADSFRTLLANRLGDSDKAVRNAAAFALGQLFSSAAAGALSTALDSEKDKDILLQLILALGKSETNTTPEWLLGSMESGDEDIQKALALAIGSMAYRGYYPMKTIPFINRRLNLPTTIKEDVWYYIYPMYRISALQTFQDFTRYLTQPGQTSETKYYLLRGLETLVSMINTPEFNANRSQKGFREVYAIYNTREFRNLIIQHLQDNNWYVRLGALYVANAMGESPVQTEALKLVNDPHPNMQLEALKLLETNNRWLARREARRVYTESDDWRMKGQALTLLATVQPKEALTNIKKEWMEKSWPHHYYTLQALDKIEITEQKRQQAEADEATRLMVELADQNNIAQTTTAIEYLVNRSRPPAMSYFLEKLKIGDLALTAIIANYLAVLTPRPENIITPLTEAYASFTAPKDLEAMTAIIAALDSIGNKDATPFLESQLANPYPAVRESAEAALKRITKKTNIIMPKVAEAYPLKWDFPQVSTDSSYSVTFQTNQGSFTIALHPEKAPVTVANIIELVKKGFYNGILFHRVAPGFVVQAGDPRGDGWGGTDYTIPAEYSDLFFERGAVGIADAGKDTGSSQFFVTQTPQPHLNGKYTLFGSVTEGMDTIDKLMIFDRIEKATLNVQAKSGLAAAN